MIIEDGEPLSVQLNASCEGGMPPIQVQVKECKLKDLIHGEEVVVDLEGEVATVVSRMSGAMEDLRCFYLGEEPESKDRREAT